MDTAADRRNRWFAIALLTAVLAGVAYGGWLFLERHRSEVAAAQALDAATRYAVTLTSIDSGDLDQYLADIRDGSTDQLQDMYAKSGARLQQRLADKNVVAHGRVVDSAIKSATPTTVRVLLFIDESVSNADDPDPHIDRSRVDMTMTKVDGRWLVARMEMP